MAFLFFLLCLLLTFLVNSQIAQSITGAFPSLNLATVKDFTKSISLNNSAGTFYVEMDTTDFYVSRLTDSGKIEIYDISTGVLRFNIFGPTNYPSSVPVTNYDILENETQYLSIVSSSNNQNYIYNLTSSGQVLKIYQTQVLSVDVNPRFGTQMLKNEFLMVVTKMDASCISRRKKSGGWGLVEIIWTKFMTPTFNMKTCKADINDNFFRVVIWKRNCYVFVANCPVLTTCKVQLTFNNTACTSSEYGSTTRDFYKVTWNKNCTKILFQSKNQGLQMVDLRANTTFITFPVASTSTPLNGFWFIDDSDQFIGVSKPDGNFQLYNVTSRVILETKTVPASKIVSYNRLKKKLFVSDGEKLLCYKFACNFPNYTLDATGLCVFNASYVPPAQNTTNQTKTNQTITTQTNQTNTTQTNQTSTTQNNTLTNQSQTNQNQNILTNQTNMTQTNQNQTNMTGGGNSVDFSNNTDISSLNPGINYQQEVPEDLSNFNVKTLSPEQMMNQILKDQSFVNLSISEYKKFEENSGDSAYDLIKMRMRESSAYAKLINMILEKVLDAALKPVGVITKLMKVLPVSSLFIGFINFWMICSMYLLLRVNLPSFLTVYLIKVHNMTSGSIFQNFGWQVYFVTGTSQKFDHKSYYQAEQYGLSSDFVNSNFSNFALISFSYLILCLLLFIQSKLPEQNFFRKSLNCINFKIALSGQFISIMSNFFFNLPIIVNNSQQNVFEEKINMVLQNFFFVFSMFVSGMVFVLISQEIDKPTFLGNRKSRQWTWLFDSQCNCLLPIAVMFNVAPMFLIFNAVFFCIPIYTALKQRRWRWIALIKSFYLPLFNAGVATILILDLSYFKNEKYDDAKQIVTVCTTCMIGIGATHEVLEFAVRILYTLIRMTLKLKNRISNEDSQKMSGEKCESKNTGLPRIAILKMTTSNSKPTNGKINFELTTKFESEFQDLIEGQGKKKIWRENHDHLIGNVKKQVNVKEKSNTTLRLERIKNRLESTKFTKRMDNNLKITVLGKEEVRGFEHLEECEDRLEILRMKMHTERRKHGAEDKKQHKDQKKHAETEKKFVPRRGGTKMIKSKNLTTMATIATVVREM